MPASSSSFFWRQLRRWLHRQSFLVQLIVTLAVLTAAAVWLFGSPVARPKAADKLDATLSGNCLDKLPFGAPRQARPQDNVRFICRSGYALGHSGATKTPLWVAEYLKAVDTGGTEPRTNEFLEDSELPANHRATLKDYARSGFDRGHMAPAADFSRSAREMKESFYLSNMVPQVPDNNRGAWAQLESHVRIVVRRAGELQVITGPAFESSDVREIGPNRVRVPSLLYKIAYDARRQKMGAWLLPNAAMPKEQWNKYCTSVAAVEAATGLEFFPQMPSAQRMKLREQTCAL